MKSRVPTIALLSCVVALGTATVFARGQQAAATGPDLTNPAAFTETAPDVFLSRFDTTAGEFTIRVTRTWAPNGADRFYNLVKAGFYDECRLFRVIPDYVVQWGINGNPAVSAAWNKALIKSDRAKMSNTRGRISFAQGTFSSQRSTQVFVNYGDNSKKLDMEGFAAFGEVITGMVMLDRAFSKNGEGPDPKALFTQGNEYLLKRMPNLDYIKTAKIVEK